MGNRSRYVATTAAAATAALVTARRRARLRRAAEGMREAILPTHAVDLPGEPVATVDEAHAPGHQHLPRGEDRDPAVERLRRRAGGRYTAGRRHRLADR